MKKIAIIYILALSIALLLQFTTFAQQQFIFPDQYTINNYSQENGMPQNSARHALFDQYGFLWIITEDGLARFDGNAIKVVATPLSKRITRIYKKNETVIIVEDVNNNYVTIERGKVKEKVFSAREFSNIIFPISATFIDYLKNIDKSKWDNNDYNYKGFPVKNKDTICIVFKTGMGFYNKNGLFKEVVIPNFIHQHVFKTSDNITYYDKERNKLIFYNTRGNIDTTIPFKIKTSDRIRFHFDLGLQRCLIQYDSVLLSLTRDQNGAILLTPILNCLGKHYYTNFITNNEGHIIGLTSNEGIFAFKKSDFKPLFPTSILKNGTASYYAQVLMPDEQTIFTTANNLYNSQGYAGQLQLPFVPLRTTMLRTSDKNYIYFTYNDKDGNILWKCKKSIGNQDTFYYFKHENPEILHEDQHKNIWVITNKTISLYNNGSRSVYIKNNLGDVSCMTNGTNNDIWLGTTNGLYHYSFAHNYFTRIGLAGKNINFIHNDSSTKSIWIATYGSGLFRLSLSENKIYPLPKDENDFLTNIHNIVEDRYHRFWFATNNGLYVTQRSTLVNYCLHHSQKPYYYRFNIKDGLKTNEFNGGCEPAFIKLSNGTISLPTINGLLWFNPDKMNIPFSVSPIFIDELKINDKKQIIPENYRISANSPNCRIDIELSTVNWSNENNNYIEYAITKNNDTTNMLYRKIGQEKKIIIPFLSDGNYTISLRKRIGFEYNDYVYTKLIISVTPAWYQKWYFYTTITLISILLIWLLMKSRNKYIINRNKVLEKQITRATEKLIDEKLKLEQSNNIKEKLIATFNHDISIPLFYMNRVLHSVTNNKLVPESLLQPLQLISNTSEELQHLTDDLLVWVALQKDKQNIIVNKESCELLEIIQEKWKIFESQSSQQNITLNCSFPAATTVYSDKKLLGIIIYNILSNSVKYMQQGIIDIQTQHNPTTGGIILSINDLPQYGNLPVHKGDIQSRGVGSEIIKDLCKTLSIWLNYDTNETGGTKITLQIPEP